MDEKELKPKSLEEIKKEFDNKFNDLFYSNGVINTEEAFNLISSINKLIPQEEKINFTRSIVSEILIWGTDNAYEALGVLDLTKHDLIVLFNEIEEDDLEETEEE